MPKNQEWIVRTKDLFISRPMSEKDLIKKIEKGDLNPLDEICPATGYWFGLHEAEEVRKHLGDIDLSRLTSGMQVEITSSTETSTVKKTLILEVPKSWSPPGVESQPAPSPVSPAKKMHSKAALEVLEKQWTPALIFSVIFIVVLIFLWMNSD